MKNHRLLIPPLSKIFDPLAQIQLSQSKKNKDCDININVYDDQEKKKGVNQMCEILDEVKEEGKNEGKIELLVDLVKTGVLSISKAAEMANMSEEELKKYL